MHGGVEGVQSFVERAGFADGLQVFGEVPFETSPGFFFLGDLEQGRRTACSTNEPSVVGVSTAMTLNIGAVSQRAEPKTAKRLKSCSA